MSPRLSIWSGLGLAVLAAVVYVLGGAATNFSQADLMSHLQRTPHDAYELQRRMERSIMLRERGVIALSGVLLFGGAVLTAHGLIRLHGDSTNQPGP